MILLRLGLPVLIAFAALEAQAPARRGNTVADSQAPSLERAESLLKQQQYDGANAEFRLLVKAHPKNPDYRVRWGRLFLERFNNAEAAKLFEEALQIKKDHAGALMGLALVAADGFEAKAVEFAERALVADPKLTEARVLLARLALEDNDPVRAAEQADKALYRAKRAGRNRVELAVPAAVGAKKKAATRLA